MWEFNGQNHPTTLNKYQKASLELVLSRHPGMPPSQAVLQAKAEWEAAALAFMVQTLQECKAMRPRARWGYYGFPATQQVAVWGLAGATRVRNGLVQRTIEGRSGKGECSGSVQRQQPPGLDPGHALVRNAQLHG